MYSINKFEKRIGGMGKPIPTSFPTLSQHEAEFRFAELAMLAGRPGSFKSITALNLLKQWTDQGLFCLYFSADSQEATVARRLSALATGDNSRTVDGAFNVGDTQKYTKALKHIGKYSKFIYRQQDMEGIVTLSRTFDAIVGGYPDVIVVDNLVNFVDRPDDWGGMLMVLKELDAFTRETKSHTLVLHHAKIDDNDAGVPPKDWEIQGKLTQIPRLALTVAARQNAITMACVKNTNGFQDPAAESKNWMHFKLQPNLSITDHSREYIDQGVRLVSQLTGEVVSK